MSWSELDTYDDIVPDMVEIYRQGTNSYYVRLPINGMQVISEWRMTRTNTALHQLGKLVIDNYKSFADITVESNLSNSEPVMMLGVSTDLEGDYDFVGGVHGNQSQTAETITLDGADITGLAVGKSAWGSVVVFDQDINLIYPKDGSTVAGTCNFVHTFTTSQLSLTSTFDFNAALDWRYHTFYGAMGPVQITGMDTFQVAGFSAELADSDNAAEQSGTEAASCTFTDTGHSYTFQMSLPTGAPGPSWAASGLKAWVHDRSDGLVKCYMEHIQSDYAARVAVADTTHNTNYRIF